MASAKPSQKLKTIIPTLREKTRYLTFRITSDGGIRAGDVSPAIWGSALSLLGESGTAACGLWVMDELFDPRTQSGVIRAGSAAVESVKASLALIHDIGGVPVTVGVTCVSGMIRNAKDARSDDRQKN